MPVNGAPMLYPPLFTLYLIRQQSGLAKAKPLSMHNKTLIRIVCRGGHRRWRGKPSMSPQGAAPEQVPGSASVTPGPGHRADILTPFVVQAGRGKRARFTSLREYPQVSSRNRRKLDCARKTGFHFAANRKEEFSCPAA